MASEEVQGIQIPITLDVAQAEAMMKQLSEKVKGLKAKASKSDKKKSGGDNVKAMGKATKEAGATMAKFAKGLVALLAVGKLINKIKQLMDQGSKNLYQYSKMQGGAYSKTLDAFASARESLANSLGALKATFVSVIAPMITSFFNRLVPIINKVTKIVAELFGLPTYWQAKSDIFKQFDSTIQDARELISGFDSLNVFSGILDTPTSEMFEEVKNEKSAGKGIFDEIKSQFTDIFENIKGILKNILTAIFGEDFVNALFSGDFSSIKNEMNKIIKNLGLDELFSAFKDAFTEITGVIKDITESAWFQSAINTIKSILKLFSGIATTALSFIADLIRWFNGEMTWSEVWANLKDNLVDKIWGSLKEVWHNLQLTVVEFVDKIYVWWHNKFKTDEDKIEHAGFWYDYHPEVRTALLMATNTPKTSPYATPDYSNYSNEEWQKELKNWQNRGFTGGLPGIPGSANGGVFSKPTLTYVGEYSGARTNPEIITPQNLLDERLDLSNKNLLASLYQMNSQLVDAISNMNMTVNLDSQTIARASAKGAQDYYMMTGKSLMR